MRGAPQPQDVAEHKMRKAGTSMSRHHDKIRLNLADRLEEATSHSYQS
jgi:hypothetical protein